MRKNNNFTKKRTFMIALFIMIIAGVSIGYAALQTTLTINGKTKIKKTTFCVQFQNAQQQNTTDDHSVDPADTEGDQGITIDAASDANNNCPNHASWAVTLKEPGDFYEFNIDVANVGTLNAVLDSVTDRVVDSTKPDYIIYTVSPVAVTSASDDSDFANFVNGTKVPGQAGFDNNLNSGKKFRLNFKVLFSTDIDPSDLPREPQEIKFEYKLDYSQAS